MADRSIASPNTDCNEDYVGSVCLLHILTKKFPVYEEILVDTDDFERLKQDSWRLVMVNRRSPSKRVVRKDRVYLAVAIMNPPQGMFVDHRDRQPLDNRKANLRVCTPQQNNLNSNRQKNGSSRFRGVHLYKGRWKVQGGRRSKPMYLGIFDSEIAAAKAYNEYARREYGEFAFLNEIDE